MRSIYIGNKSSRHGCWTSFETDAHLTLTKKNIYGQCFPCIENLLNQLVESRQEIELGQAFDCWKVVAVLGSDEECLKVLERYQKKLRSSRYLQGRFGSGEEGKSGTRAVIINTDNEEERDIILSELEHCAGEVDPDSEVFYSRACAILYGELLGDWRDWGKVTPIKNPGNVGKVIKLIRKVLYET